MSSMYRKKHMILRRMGLLLVENHDKLIYSENEKEIMQNGYYERYQVRSLK